MISFKNYLKMNKSGHQPTSVATFAGYKVPVDYNSNSQAIGDVTGGEGGSIPGEEEELSLLNTLLYAPENEEGTLELVDDEASDEDKLDLNGEEDTSGNDMVGKIELPNDADEETGNDPDKQGLIRKIPGAHLVYKREGEDGAYEELWMYELKKGFRDEYDIRDDILAGTDIPPTQTKSPDDSQSYTMWTAGNMQLMKIVGLPN